MIGNRLPDIGDTVRYMDWIPVKNMPGAWTQEERYAVVIDYRQGTWSCYIRDTDTGKHLWLNNTALTVVKKAR